MRIKPKNQSRKRYFELLLSTLLLLASVFFFSLADNSWTSASAMQTNRISRVQVVVLSKTLEAGATIRAEDVTLELHPAALLPEAVATRVEDVIGKRLRERLPSGAPLAAEELVASAATEAVSPREDRQTNEVSGDIPVSHLQYTNDLSKSQQSKVASARKKPPAPELANPRASTKPSYVWVPGNPFKYEVSKGGTVQVIAPDGNAQPLDPGRTERANGK